LKRGDTFVNTNEGSYWHLWIVCIGFPDGSILMFNITTLDRAIDTTCIIRQGEHPWVRWDSAVVYEHSKLVDPRRIAVLEALNCMEPHESASDDLIQKILEHAMLSPETPGTFKAIIEAVLDEAQGDT
jgi:hypothetical protein